MICSGNGSFLFILQAGVGKSTIYYKKWEKALKVLCKSEELGLYFQCGKSKLAKQGITYLKAIIA